MCYRNALRKIFVEIRCFPAVETAGYVARKIEKIISELLRLLAVARVVA